jgi:FtsZ-binding cell division protein ZapB
MKISKIHTNHLRNDAYFQFHTEFKDLVEKTGAAALKIEALFQSYLPLFKNVDDGLKKINKSVITEQIQEADKARDEIWSGLIEMNKAAAKHFNADVREASALLKTVFDTYGNLAVKPLNEETSAIYNILQELEGKYAAAAEKVGITQWIAELKIRNNKLSELVKERFDESASKSDIVVKDARTQLDQLYASIAERIDALLIVEGAEVHEAFIKTWNVIITKYAAGLNRGKKG